MKTRIFKNIIPLLKEIDGNRVADKLPNGTDYKIIWGNTKWVLNTLKDGTEQLISRNGVVVDLNDKSKKWFEEVL